MAYDKTKIYNQLLDNIKDHEHITSFEDAAASVAPSRDTLYEWNFHKSDDIKRAISENKIAIKKSLRRQWAKDSASATLQLALYKLLATDDERRALAMEYREHSGEIKLPTIKVDVVKSNESK